MSLVGDVMSFHVFGQVIIVLNSVKATKDLLEKRGEIYSDRPVIPFYEMCGLTDLFVPGFLIDNVQDGVGLVLTDGEVW